MTPIPSYICRSNFLYKFVSQ